MERRLKIFWGSRNNSPVKTDNGGVFRMVKSGMIDLKTDDQATLRMRVYLKIVHSDTDARVQIHTDPEETYMFGHMSLLKCAISRDKVCNKTFSIFRRAIGASDHLQCVKFVATSNRDAEEWLAALTFDSKIHGNSLDLAPSSVRNTPSSGPTSYYTRKIRLGD